MTAWITGKASLDGLVGSRWRERAYLGRYYPRARKRATGRIGEIYAGQYMQ